MKRSLLPIVLWLFTFAAPALALNNRSAVSVSGVDTNPCTPASPCRSFGAAIAATNAGGEVIALDTAGYGPFTVNASMTVSGAPGVHAAITTATANGILVNAATTDRVTLQNLVLIADGGNDGINDQSAAELVIIDCTVRGFGDAILTAYGHVIVQHCVLESNGTGVYLNGITNNVATLITDSLITDYSQQGLFLFQSASAMITRCTIAGGQFGVNLQVAYNSGVATRAAISNSTIAFNSVALELNASGTNNTAIAYIGGDDIAFTPIGVQSVGGTVETYGNNRFEEVPTVGTLVLIGQQ